MVLVLYMIVNIHVKDYRKRFGILYYQDAFMDLVSFWHVIVSSSKDLFYTAPTPAIDLEVKVTG